MVFTPEKKSGWRALMASVIIMAIMYTCLIVIGGKAALCAIIVYSTLLALASIGLISRVIFMKATSINVGIEVTDGKKSLKMEKFDKYTTAYESRHSTLQFWVSTLITLLWLALFLSAGVNFLAYVIIALVFTSEINTYRIYSCIKKNKTVWGTAMYINEIQNFFNGGGKQ